MSYQPTILTDLKDGVLTVTLNRVDKKNAFNNDQYDDLRDEFDKARENDEVVCMVITNAGGTFSAGQDLAVFSGGGGKSERPATSKAPSGFPGYQDALLAFDKPLIIAVNGPAVGIGATTLLHADIIYVSESSRIRFPFVSLGIVPEAGSSVLLPMMVGPQKAAELLLSADWISADECVELGIAAAKYADDEVLAKAQERAAQIAGNAPSSLVETKRMLLDWRRDIVKSATEREVAALGRTVGQPENMEAIMAFMQKRKPNFTGKRNKRK